MTSRTDLPGSRMTPGPANFVGASDDGVLAAYMRRGLSNS